MDQKMKLTQEAVVSRDSAREELVDVYLCVRRLSKENLPPPQESTQDPYQFCNAGVYCGLCKG
eukprot:6478075-Amphidinium_carterae.3